MFSCLQPGAQQMFRHKRKKLDTLHTIPHPVGEWSCITLWTAFSLSVGQILSWRFLLLHFYWNVRKWILKLILTRVIWFWSIFRNLLLLFAVIGAWAHISVNCSIAFLFWRYRLYSMFSLGGFLVCFLKVQELFCCSVFFYRLMRFIDAMQLYFHCFSGSPAFFCKYWK